MAPEECLRGSTCCQDDLHGDLMELMKKNWNFIHGFFFHLSILHDIATWRVLKCWSLKVPRKASPLPMLHFQCCHAPAAGGSWWHAAGNMGVSSNRDTPIAGWFIIMENPKRNGWFWGTPMYGSPLKILRMVNPLSAEAWTSSSTGQGDRVTWSFSVNILNWEMTWNKLLPRIQTLVGPVGDVHKHIFSWYVSYQDQPIFGFSFLIPPHFCRSSPLFFAGELPNI